MLSEEFLLFTLLAVCVFLGFAAIWPKELDKRRLKRKSPPGPINFPIIGSLFQMALTTGSGPLSQQYRNLCRRYGRIMAVKVGILNMVVIEDYAAVREILHSADFTSRFPTGGHYRGHTFGENLGLIFSYGETWKEIRKFAIKTLCEFGFGELNIAEQYLSQELECFQEHFEQLRKNSNGALQMNGIFEIPMVNILWRMFMGVRLDYGDEEAHHIIQLVKKASATEFGLHPYFAFPWIRYIPGMNPVKGFNLAFETMHIYFRKILNNRRQAGHGIGENQTNFLDRLIHKSAEERQNPNTIFTDEQIVVVMEDLLGASLDTTANSFEFAFMYMIKYPEVQRKVQAELDEVIGRNRVPDVYDRANLPYTEATMLETLRHANVLPAAVRSSTCDTVVQGYHIPKNTFCGLNLTAIHMDEEIWGDPLAFRPERFLDENRRVIRDNKLLAFGGGKRLCIGHTMAKVTWLAFFAALLQKYSFEVSEKFPDISTVPISGFTNAAQTFYCNVKLR